MAGLSTAVFKDLDQKGTECAMINQMSLDWALQRAGSVEVQLYNQIGTKMMFGADKESLNGGSWIIDPM